MAMVLAELTLIRQSITEMRTEVNGKLGLHASDIARLIEWRETHEQMAQANRELIRQNQDTISEIRGGLRAIRWIGGAIGAILAAVEAWLHRGRP